MYNVCFCFLGWLWFSVSLDVKPEKIKCFVAFKLDTRGNTFSEFNGKKTCPICFSKKFVHFQFWETNKEKMWYRGIRADMCYQLSGGVPIEKVNGFYHLWTRLGLFQLFNQPKCISCHIFSQQNVSVQHQIQRAN